MQLSVGQHTAIVGIISLIDQSWLITLCSKVPVYAVVGSIHKASTEPGHVTVQEGTLLFQPLCNR
jgi:hypothetical protein